MCMSGQNLHFLSSVQFISSFQSIGSSSIKMQGKHFQIVIMFKLDLTFQGKTFKALKKNAKDKEK